MGGNGVEVIGIGTACVDILANIPKMPKANEGTRIKDYSWQGGGNVATAIVALAKLGAQCGMIGVVGGCDYGRFCLKDFQDYGIDTSQMVVDQDTETPFSIILADDHTHGRSIIYYPGTGRSLEISDLDKDYIQSAQFLHLEGVTPATKKAALWAREAGVKVVCDASSYYSAMDEMIPLIDVFIASEFYYRDVYDNEEYETNCNKLRDMGPAIVVFTLGERGCVGADSEGFFVEKAFDVEVRDTTGAGDVYHGAFIYGLLKGWDTRKTARFANVVSAIKCTRMGGRAGIPTYETVMKYLDTGIIDYEEIDNRVARYRKISNILDQL